MSEKEPGNENWHEKNVCTTVNVHHSTDVCTTIECVNSVTQIQRESAPEASLHCTTYFKNMIPCVLFPLQFKCAYFIISHCGWWQNVWLINCHAFIYPPDGSSKLFPFTSRKIGAVTEIVWGRVKSTIPEESNCFHVVVVFIEGFKKMICFVKNFVLDTVSRSSSQMESWAEAALKSSPVKVV